MATNLDRDISENKLRTFDGGSILRILLKDQTLDQNIIWATDSYVEQYGHQPEDWIDPEQITGEYDRKIQPRATKPPEEQKRRTKQKAEVFTPLDIVRQMNDLVDEKVTAKNWQAYVQRTMLEVACGEGPYIASRYDPTAPFGKVLKTENRDGFFDRKMKAINKFCVADDDKKLQKMWLKWTERALKASYGFEWQGDNLLIARENLLYTVLDFYKAKFGGTDILPGLDGTISFQSDEMDQIVKSLGSKKIKLEIFAQIISWNVFQMDGLKFRRPLISVQVQKPKTGQISMFEPDEFANKDNQKTDSGPEQQDLLDENRFLTKIRDWNDKEISLTEYRKKGKDKGGEEVADEKYGPILKFIDITKP